MHNFCVHFSNSFRSSSNMSLNYEDANDKLDRQLHKLQVCKTEMKQLFKELDSMISDSSDTESDSRAHDYHHKSGSFVVETSDDERAYDSKEYLSDSSSDYSDYEKPAKTSYQSAKIKFSYKSPVQMSYADFDLEELIRSAEGIHKSNTLNKLTNEQYNYIADNIVPNHLHYEKFESNRVKHNSSKLSSKSATFGERKNLKNVKKTAVSTPPKPTWLPNGKFKHSNSQSLYKSTSSLSKLSTSTLSLKTSLPKPWKHVGRTRPNSAVFYSSQEVAKSKELPKPQKKVALNDSKDVGTGWKPIGKLEADKKVFFVPESTETKEKTLVKNMKKKLYDPKDVSTGWKVVGKLKEENYFKTDPTYVRQPPQISPAEELKKILAKNATKVWKPAGTGKSLDTLVYVKPPLPVKTQPPELPKKKLKPESTAKKWTPSSKLKASFPNTWLPENSKEPKASTPKVPKPSSKPITKKAISKPESSTPNMSLVIADKPSSRLVDDMEEIIKEEELINEMMSKNSSTKLEPLNESPAAVVEDKSNLNEVISSDDKNLEANKSIEDEKETSRSEPNEKENTVENETQQNEQITAENNTESKSKELDEKEIINKSNNPENENPVNDDDDEEDDEANQLWNRNFEDDDSDT